MTDNEAGAYANLSPEIETAASLSKSEDELITQAEAPHEQQQEKIGQLMKEIDINDSNSIIFFGLKAQEQLTRISDRMLEGVRNKDLGTAGDLLNEMAATLRGFEIDDLDPNKKPGFFARLFGRARPLARVLQRYESVRREIDSITDRLEDHKTLLLTDIITLDRLYEANLEHYHDLEHYIAAGDEKLKQLDEAVIPAKERESSESGGVVKTQELKDLRSRRNDLQRRLHDLRLTRHVSMQSMPSIRLVQENDKGLVTKINSTMANTIPLWRQQLAIAAAIFRSGDATRALKKTADLTNERLVSNAETLKNANAETRKQLERGQFDIESVKKANQLLIETIEESLQIADEGKRKRVEAVAQLENMESEFKQTLASANAITS